jgi:hypothetical protein
MTYKISIELEKLRELNVLFNVAQTLIEKAQIIVGEKIDEIAAENLPRNDEVEIPRRRPRPQKEPEVK